MTHFFVSLYLDLAIEKGWDCAWAILFLANHGGVELKNKTMLISKRLIFDESSKGTITGCTFVLTWEEELGSLLEVSNGVNRQTCTFCKAYDLEHFFSSKNGNVACPACFERREELGLAKEVASCP